MDIANLNTYSVTHTLQIKTYLISYATCPFNSLSRLAMGQRFTRNSVQACCTTVQNPTRNHNKPVLLETRGYGFQIRQSSLQQRPDLITSIALDRKMSKINYKSRSGVRGLTCYYLSEQTTPAARMQRRNMLD